MSDKVTVQRESGDGPLGDLTERQMAELEKCATLSPGFTFTLRRFAGGFGSRFTNVEVWRDGKETATAGLVGRTMAQVHDQGEDAERAVRRVAQRVYGQRNLRFEQW